MAQTTGNAGSGSAEFRSALGQLAEGMDQGQQHAPRSGREGTSDEHPAVAALAIISIAQHAVPNGIGQTEF